MWYTVLLVCSMKVLSTKIFRVSLRNNGKLPKSYYLIYSLSRQCLRCLIELDAAEFLSFFHLCILIV
jgi:hypothetical protein